jgi:hypothetical protein
MGDGTGKRVTLSGIAAVLVLGAIGGLAQQSARYALRTSGGDALAYRFMAFVASEAAHYLTSPIFITIACAAVGAAIYSWADFVVRRWIDRTKSA